MANEDGLILRFYLLFFFNGSLRILHGLQGRGPCDIDGTEMLDEYSGVQ
jgi:hypothetical protein